MQTLEKILSDIMLIDLLRKECSGANISKAEFDLMVESRKLAHEKEVDNCLQLSDEQKRKLKDSFNKAADNIKEYSQECLRINGRLIE
jgi:phage-related tail protein